MAYPIVNLLGSFSVHDQGELVTAFESDKVRALLSYLIVENNRIHRRETLAGLFWPEFPEQRARRNLSQATYNLRQTLDHSPDSPPILLSTQQTLMLNPTAGLSSDIIGFEALVDRSQQHRHQSLTTCDTCQKTLDEALALYRGPFLDGFSLAESPAFEEWLLLRREQLQRMAVEMAQQLTASHETAGKIEAALDYARRWAELAPWQEAAHRRVMRLLALNGRQGEALAYYDTCCRLLREEIGVEPRESTRWLVEDIRTGRIRTLEAATAMRPLPLDPASPPASQSRPPFVGRTRQMAELEQRLEQALIGEGQILFVAGEAGSGKTALLQQFAKESHERHPELLTVWGRSNAFTGSGDPYLPFRQALGLLTGEATRGYEMGYLDEEQTQRLWAALPLAVGALLNDAPGLTDVFMPGVDLVARVGAAVEGNPDWLAALRTELEKHKSLSTGLNRVQLHEQTLAFLRGLSARRALLLLLDDLHWVDTDSVSLLFHLARSLSGLRLLVVGAFRQEDIDIGRDGRLHPVKVLLAEYKRLSGIKPINLNRLDDSERRDFVERLVDAEHNQLDADFRQALFEHTGGHALFTVEALREFEARGDIIWQEEGGWVQQHPFDWHSIPPRAQGVIEARVERLPANLQELLAVASVEGETFSAQTLAEALDRQLGEVVSGLSDELDRVHRLVAEAGTTILAGKQIGRFRFRHSLFRQYIYDSLGKQVRALRHKQVGAILEEAYGAQAHTIAPQLALHFDLGDVPERAITHYLSVGDQARLLYADEQAKIAYRRALELALLLKDDEQAARIHMRLGLTHHNTLDYERAQTSYAEGFRLWNRTYSEPKRHLASTDRPLRMIWGLAPRNEEPTFDFIDDLFSVLVEETPDLEIVPDVAYQWDILNRGRTYVFHLRDDVLWSDGEPLTAHDFAFAWQHNRLPNQVAGEPLYNVKGGRVIDYGIAADLQQVDVAIPDPYTLVVTLPQPAAYFLHLLSHPLAAPKPRHVVRCHGDAWATAENIVSNGPFLLEHWDADNDKMHFVRNHNYHGRSSGNVTHVEALYFRQPIGWERQLTLYEQDLVDILLILNWDRQGFGLARRQHVSEYWQSPLFTTFIHCFDTTRPPFDDVRVRQALAMAFDREQALARSGKQTSRPTYGGFIPPGMPGHSPDIALPYDPDRARQLMAEAGYPHGVGFPEVELARFYASDGEESARYYTDQWRQTLGIPITYRILEWTAYWRYLAHGSPHIMVMNGLGTYSDPDAFMRQSFRTVQKLTGWHHPDYEELIAQAGSSPNQDDRLRYYRQADALLIQEAPLIPMSYHDAAYLTKPWIKQMPRSPVGAARFWKDVVLEPL